MSAPQAPNFRMPRRVQQTNFIAHLGEAPTDTAAPGIASGFRVSQSRNSRRGSAPTREASPSMRNRDVSVTDRDQSCLQRQAVQFALKKKLLL